MRSRHAPRHPTLPQKDGASVREGRARQLAHSRARYAWASVAALPAVPVVASLVPEERPTLPWLVSIARVAVDVVTNVLLAKVSDGGPAPATLLAAHGASAGREVDAVSHAALQEVAAIDVEIRALEHVEQVASAPLPQASGVLGAGVLDPVDRVLAHLDRLAEIAAREGRVSSGDGLAAYQAIFRTIPLPEIAPHVYDDDTFAQLRVAGPNPMLLAAVTELPEGVPVTDAAWQAAMGGSDDLAEALCARRVFVVDYEELAGLRAGTTDGVSKVAFAPVAVFGRRADGDALIPVWIQVDRTTGAAGGVPWVPVGDAHRWNWEMAKLTVQIADMNYHELFVHLARTHLVLEAVAVATHRELADIHPLFALLLPHLEGTLFINQQAAGSLISDAKSPIGQVFAGTIASTQAVTSQDRLKVRVRDAYLPADLARRGVDSREVLPVYPYRDDALRIWGAIEDWVRAYVGVYYLSDTDVMADSELAAWHAALATDGRLDDMPTLRTVNDVVGLLTYVVFTASAQHAAVNFPQRTLMSYAPVMTGAGWSAGHVDRPATADDWLAMLPSVDLALQQLSVTTVLGTLVYRPLGTYEGYGLGADNWFSDPAVTGPLLAFRGALDEVTTAITKDNAALNAWARPYPYLLPARVPASINI